LTSEMVNPQIWAKLSNVSRACSYVKKDGTNQFHRYNYATAAIIFEKVNLALFDNGLVSRTEWVQREQQERQTSGGKKEIVETLQVKLIITDIETGESVSQYAYGCGADASDKAVMKAQTAALKYAWMMLLNISTGDDPEGDAKTDSRAEGKPMPKAEPRGPYKGNQVVGDDLKPGSVGVPVAEDAPTTDSGNLLTQMIAQLKESDESSTCKCGAPMLAKLDSKGQPYGVCQTAYFDKKPGQKVDSKNHDFKRLRKAASVAGPAEEGIGPPPTKAPAAAKHPESRDEWDQARNALVREAEQKIGENEPDFFSERVQYVRDGMEALRAKAAAVPF